MSNPKVFEFAKEIGMTPLALMDKIREWHLPLKSHMAEIEPEVLEQIKIKLNGGKSSEEVKPKKTVARKAPAKKVAAPAAEPVAPAGAAKAPVIRRKAKEAKEAEVEALEAKAEVEVEEAPVEAPVTTAKKAPVQEVATPAVEAKVEKAKAKVEAPVAAPAAPAAAASDTVAAPAKAAKVEAKSEVKAEPKKAEAPAAVETPATPVATSPASVITPVGAGAPAPSPIVARKKEVVVGTSGIASSSTPASTVKRNIIGRMDLSRVTPQGAPRREGGPTANTGSTGGGFNNNNSSRPGGFNRPAGGAGPSRSIRPGFVAQVQTPIEPATVPDRDFTGKDHDKRSKKLSGPAPASTTKELGEVVQFNAVEFRKREMVFQPKKRKGTLDRTAMKTQLTTPKASKRVVKINGTMKVSDLAMEMGLKAPQLTKALMGQGVMAKMGTELDFDTIALIVPEFGWEAQNVYKTADEVAELTAFGELDAEQIIRPPVVTVMGHVDHGKTSLLDAIRNANVAKGESGGITQHIGAYSVTMEDGSLITFLDTPGHEAFTAMRARGANATDIAVIVVAADDGMMPQTAEAINHAKAAGVPIIVAVNKIDKPGANPERIKQQLTELEIVPEEWGGTTIFREVSALKKTGITELLEQIKLVAEVAELKANPKRSGTGVVIEAKMEKGKGPVATLLVKDGTVSVGQYIVAGHIKGRIRSLVNDRGERVASAGPGIPVEAQGLESVPSAGDKFDIVKDEDTAVKVSELRKEQSDKAASTPAAKMSLDEIFAKVKAGDVKELTLVLKADVDGSVEAIKGMLAKLSTVEVKARVIHTGVGGINEGDVLLAHTAKGIVLGFNVRPDSGAQAKAKQLGVDIRTYSIVYELVDEMKKAMAGMLTPDVVEEVLGRIEVRNTFTVPKAGTIAGCFVLDGKVQRNNMLRLVRDGKIVYEGKISSLKRFKDDAKEVAAGYECGIGIENFNDVKVGDIMEPFVKKEIARELTASPSV